MEGSSFLGNIGGADAKKLEQLMELLEDVDGKSVSERDYVELVANNPKIKELMGFTPYQHVEKMFTAATDGLTDGYCYVFPKLDGTNASVWREFNFVFCGSRKRPISELCDNQGFAAYVKANSEAFKLMLMQDKYKNCTLYGEWLVPHTFRGYSDEAWNNFYLFDVYDRVTQKYIPYHDYVDDAIAAGIKVLHPVMSGNNLNESALKDCVENFTTHLIPNNDDGIGEGVVVKRYDFVNKFGRTVWGKYLNEKFIGMAQRPKQPKEMSQADRDMEELLTKMCERFVTEHLVKKCIVRACPGGEWDRRLIPMLLGNVWYDFINEEMHEAIKYFHSPTVDFKRLRGFVNARVKQLAPTLF